MYGQSINHPSTRPRLAHWLGSAATLAIVTWLCFGQSLFHAPVYDDQEIWGDKPAAQLEFIHDGVTPRGVKTAFTTRYGNIWQPVIWISHMLDTTLFGAHNLPPARAVNLLLHFANSLLICFLFSRWLRTTWPALLLALLWAVHPLRVESVVWLTERKDVLSTFLLLGTLCFFHFFQTSPRRGLWLTATTVTFALALGAKASTVTFAGLAMILDVLVYNRHQPLTRQLRRLWNRFAWLAPILILVGGYLVLNLGSLHTIAVPFTIRIQNALASLPLYAFKTIWPTDLSYFYTYTPNIPTSRWLTGLALLAAALTIAWRARNTSPLVTFGMLWMLGSITPMLGLIQVGEQSMADRYTYIPAIGLSPVLFALASNITTRLREKTRPSLAITCLAVLAVLACIHLTRQQTRHWQNETTLYSHALGINPANHHALINLAITKLEHGDTDGAETLLTRALDLPQSEARAAFTLAAIHHLRNDTPGRIAMLKRALRRNPDHGRAHVALGWHYADTGEHDTAESYFSRAARLPVTLMEHPRHLEYATFLYSRKRYSEALVQARLAADLPNPDPRARQLVKELESR